MSKEFRVYCIDVAFKTTLQGNYPQITAGERGGNFPSKDAAQVGAEPGKFLVSRLLHYASSHTRYSILIRTVPPKVFSVQF